MRSRGNEATGAEQSRAEQRGQRRDRQKGRDERHSRTACTNTVRRQSHLSSASAAGLFRPCRSGCLSVPFRFTASSQQCGRQPKRGAPQEGRLGKSLCAPRLCSNCVPCLCCLCLCSASVLLLLLLLARWLLGQAKRDAPKQRHRRPSGDTAEEPKLLRANRPHIHIHNTVSLHFPAFIGSKLINPLRKTRLKFLKNAPLSHEPLRFMP